MERISAYRVWLQKLVCMTSFNFSMYFVSVLAKNGHFDHFWDPEWGFTDPLIICFAHNGWTISQPIVYDHKTFLYNKFQFFNVFCKCFSQKWAFWPLLGHKMGIYWPHYWHFLLIMYGAFLSISCMTIKTCLHEKFQFFNVFCKRFSQK